MTSGNDANSSPIALAGHAAPGVSVVIATLKRPDSLEETLASILACVPLPEEVIVVDGDPLGSARAVVERVGAGELITYLTASTGLTRQRNLGARAAGHEIVVFLDDDVTVPRHVFAAVLEAYEDPTVVGVTGRVLGDRPGLVARESALRRVLPGGGREGWFTRFGYPRYVRRVSHAIDVEHMSGCFMSARRALAREVGFDEKLTGYAVAEDEDFSRRLAARGRIRFVPAIEVAHRLAPHDTSREQRRAIARTLVVNRAYLFRKNFAQTPLARVQFALLVAGLGAHRLLQRDLAGVRGVIQGGVAIAGSRSRTRSDTQPVPVAFVSSHARKGGSERQLELLLEEIDPSWVKLVISLEEGGLPAAARRLGHPTTVIPTGNRRVDLLRSAVRLRAAVVRSGAAVVHANGVKAAAVAGLATAGTRVRVVWVKHDFSLDGRIAALVARRCALVVGVSEAVLRTFDGEPRPTRRVVPNGIRPIAVDRSRGRELALDAFGSRRPARVIGHVGRLDPDKGHGEVLAMLPTVLEREPEVGLIIVGGTEPGSPYAQGLAERVDELGLSDAVRFLSDREDARELVSGCELLLHTSLPPAGQADTEGCPLVALEAMFAGTPVVAYANGGLPELLGDTGRLVPRGEAAALGAATIELLQDEQLRSMLGASARQRVRSRFLVRANVAGLQECYRDALG